VKGIYLFPDELAVNIIAEVVINNISISFARWQRISRMMQYQPSNVWWTNPQISLSQKAKTEYRPRLNEKNVTVFILLLFMFLFTGRMPQSGKLPILNLLTGQKSGFSPRRGDSLHDSRQTWEGWKGTWVHLAVQNFTSIATGGGMRPPNIKIFHFLVKSRPCGATPLTDFNF